jgi:hypothetical protein
LGVPPCLSLASTGENPQARCGKRHGPDNLAAMFRNNLALGRHLPGVELALRHNRLLGHAPITGGLVQAIAAGDAWFK